MPRLVIKDTDLLKILMKHYGFYMIGRKGSHVRLKDNNSHVTTISIHNEELKQGTLGAILRQVGLTKDDIRSHL